MKMEYIELICKKAIEKFGVQNQIAKCKEELFELIIELRCAQVKGENNRAALIDEIADVTIMMRQMAMIVGEEAVSERIEYKLRRLELRILEGRRK